jgi:hypothetical protein
VANLQSNFQEIKNKFFFEVSGTKGKIVIDGLGDSYGIETMTFYKLEKGKTKPFITRYEYLEKDISLEKEFTWFIDVIEMRDKRCNNLRYNNYFLERNFVTANIIDDIYIRNGINPYDYSS